MVREVTLLPLRFGHNRGSMPPLGPLYLAGALDRADVPWRLVDSQRDTMTHPFAVDRVRTQIEAVPRGIVGLSVFNDAIPLVVLALDQVGRLPDRSLFIGGPGVTGIAEALLERVSTLDGVILGEGESALEMLATGDDRVNRMTGVYLRKDDGQIIGTGRTPRENLDALAPPAWHWCENKRYETIPWSTMRGCPFSCSFCEVTAFMGRRVNKSSAVHALDSLERAIECVGTREVAIVDDTFTLNRSHVVAICEGLLRRNLEIRFTAYSRADMLDEHVMSLLAAAGCERLYFGLDSGDDAVLKRITKGLRIDPALRTVNMAAKYFSVTASLIWGYPFETKAQMVNTIGAARTLMEANTNFPITPQLHLLSPSAGTPLFEQYGDYLELDPNADLLPIGEKGADLPESAWAVIRENPLLSSPFYRFVNPDFAEKSRLAEEFEHDLMSRIGDRIIAKLRRTKTRHVSST